MTKAAFVSVTVGEGIIGDAFVPERERLQKSLDYMNFAAEVFRRHSELYQAEGDSTLDDLSRARAAAERAILFKDYPSLVLP